MCFPKAPEAPINKPTYAPSQASKYFDISMEDEVTGKTTDLDGRTTKQNRNATAGAVSAPPTIKDRQNVFLRRKV